MKNPTLDKDLAWIFFFGDGVITAFGPGSEVGVENIINTFIVSNFESGPGAFVLL